jgi:hypothetical protein
MTDHSDDRIQTEEGKVKRRRRTWQTSLEAIAELLEIDEHPKRGQSLHRMRWETTLWGGEG